jgi:hypothetical protein
MPRSRFNRFDDRRMRVPENQRSPRTDVVDVPVAVHIPNVRACAPVDDNRLTADASEGPGRTVHPTRHEQLRLLEQFVTSLAIHRANFSPMP